MEELEQRGRSALNELGAQLDRLSRWPRDGVHPSTEAGACLQQKHRFARLSQAPCRRQPGDSAPDHHHVPGHQQLLDLLVAERDDGIEPRCASGGPQTEEEADRRAEEKGNGHRHR